MGRGDRRHIVRVSAVGPLLRYLGQRIIFSTEQTNAASATEPRHEATATEHSNVASATEQSNEASATAHVDGALEHISLLVSYH